MKFSIVTISFNQRDYLERALTSVLDQEVQELQYIVVDPGSEDGSREIIQRFASRLSAVVFEPDRGAADGLNKGFTRANGDVFGFLNSDDVLLPGALRAAGDFLESHPECDIVMGDGFMVDAAERPIRRIRAAGFTPTRYFYGAATWLQQSTFFRRRAFVAAGGFNAANRSCWDGELLVEMASRGARIGYIHRDLSLFRVHSRSITGSNRHKEIMRADTERMFAQAMGRPWRRTDALRSLLFRLERIVSHPGALESALRARIPRR